MDFRLSKEDEAFRGEVRAFLRKHLPSDWDPWSPEGDSGAPDVDTRMRRALVEQGWMTLAWPREYGGQAASHLRQLVFNEEMSYHGAPGRDRQGLNLVGPCLIVHGSTAQKIEHLPKIARGETLWCQGFSEPGAGSDLASLQTKAERRGGEYVINGQKIWTSYAQRAQWMHMLARTDAEAPKHKGITYFLLDMKTPGVEVRPLINMTGRRGFNQVFFTDVRVPISNVVGEPNRGWYVATTTLDFERSSINFSAQLRRLLDDVFRHMRKGGGSAAPLTPIARARLADLYTMVQVGRNLSYHVAWMQSRGLVPNMEASMSKLFSTEAHQRVTRGLLDILGLYGIVNSGARTQFEGRLVQLYMGSVSMTIGGGTSEIQRNVLATRGLGLPR